jgi:hypothetical protein
MYTLAYMIRVSKRSYPTPELWFEAFKKEFPGMTLQQVVREWPSESK